MHKIHSVPVTEEPAGRAVAWPSARARRIWPEPVLRAGGLLRGAARARPVAAVLFAVWVLALVGLPIARWTFGDAALRHGVALGVLAQAALVVALLVPAWGARRTVGAALAVVALAWGAELVGSRTGLPFGAYRYTAALQPQLAGVPLLVPLAWLMMLPPAWAVARAIAPGAGRLTAAALAALCFTAWDLFLDPQMVAWGFWVWEQPGGYFGIPWSNFGGWLLVAFLVSAAVDPRQLPLAPLVAVYAVTCGLELIGQAAFWALPGPALVGGFAMGGLALRALTRHA